MRLRLFAAVFLLSSLGVACSHGPVSNSKSSSAATRLDPAFGRLEKSSERRTRASGSGAVAWRNAKRNIGASGILILEQPGSMRLEVQDPMGGTIAFLVFRDGKFWYYTEERGHAWQGSETTPRFRQALPMPLRGEDFVRLLLASPNWGGELRQRGQNQVEQNGLEAKRSDFFTLDPATEELRSWRIEYSGGHTIEATYSEYNPRAGILYPNRVEIRWNQGETERTRITWIWHDIATYLPKIGEVFAIPPTWAENVKTKALNAGE